MDTLGSEEPSDSDDSTRNLKGKVDACRLNDCHDEHKSPVDEIREEYQFRDFSTSMIDISHRWI